MKKLSDYQGSDAIELWADLLDPVTEIMADDQIKALARSKASRGDIIKAIMNRHASETEKMLLRIDPEPLDGLNIVTRLLSILADIGSNEDIRSFFAYAGQEKTGRESSGSVTENTVEGA